MNSIKAIETGYAGCRFRSRLEARWAVFFDHLDIAWEYEPQGFMVPFGNRDDGVRGYLPDFWLPEVGIWVEVKGTLDADQLPLLIGATWDRTGLPRNPAGDQLNDDPATRGEGNPAGNRNGPRLLILGPVPDPSKSGNVHHVLCHHKGDVIAGHAVWTDEGDLATSYSDGNTLACDSGDVFDIPCELTSTCGRAWTDGGFTHHAYTAARSARFEHGERG